LPGGVQVHVRELSDQLRSRGHDVLVVAPAMGSPSDNGVRIVGRSIAVPYQGTVAPICPSPFSAVAIGRALAEFRPDVVHVHEPLTPSTSMFAAVRSRAPVVATFHAHAERSALFDAAAPMLKPVWRRLSLRVAVSDAARSFVTARLGDGVRIIPNGVDVPRFRDARPAGDLPGGKRIAWIGRLDRQKGFPVMVNAFELLASEDPDLHLVVAGDGRDRAAVEALSSEVRNRVVMLGAVPYPALPAYLVACEAFVAAATGQESFGMVLVEAMAAGVPVVATDIAGYREVVHDGIDGLLVPPSDAQTLAAGLRRVLHDARLARRLAKAGRARADEFSWDVVTTRLEEAYREATGG
jgi:phosphatidylinositol alpha-mannosyltransferase